MITQPYEGFNREGVGGFFTGIGWGLVGTISKPAIGVLDFASGAATAVKESSRYSNNLFIITSNLIYISFVFVTPGVFLDSFHKS
jgi:hypothetical protein